LPSPSASSSAAPVEPIGDCEDLIFIPCPRLNSTISIGIAASPFELSYSSDRSPAWTSTPSLSAASIGLAGWTLNVLASYDPSSQLLQTGDGTRRRVSAVSVTVNGQPALAVPAVDGSDIYVFDQNGRELRTVDGFTGTTRLAFAWDANGLASVTEPGNRVTRIIRDSVGTPVQIVTASGYRTQLGVVNGWLAAVIDPAGGFTHVTTTPDGLVEVVSDAAGSRYVFRYDGVGRIAEIDGPNEAKVTFSVALNNGTLTVDALSAAGRGWTSTVASDGSRVTRTYTNRSGQTATAVIDGMSRDLTGFDGTKYQLALVPDSFWGLGVPVVSATSTTPAGRTSTVNESRTGAAIATDLAPTSWSHAITIDGSAWQQSFDPSARALTSKSPDGRTGLTSYDEQGRTVNVSVDGQAPIAYAYDSGGRIATVTVGTGTDARKWTYEYDLATGGATVTNPAGDKKILTSNALGNATVTSTGTGSEVEVAQRDAIGRIAGYGGGALGMTQLSYRTDGRVDSLTLPAGDGLRYSTFTYDSDGVVSGTQYADGTAVAFDRDGSGRITKIDPGIDPYNLGYDATTGALTTLDGSTERLQRVVDGRALISEAWSGVVNAQTNRTLDGQSRVTSDEVNGQQSVAYAYDASGFLTHSGDLTITRDPRTGLITAETIGQLVRAFEYDSFGAISRQTVTADGSSVYELDIKRDSLGRVVERDQQLPGGKSSSETYTYDDAGRLTSQTIDGNKTTYAYDASGNLTQESGATTVDYTYDARGVLLSRGDTTYTYDVAGRLATATSSSGTTTYEYDRSGRLLSVSLADGTKIQYVVDGVGRRVGRLVNGQLQAGFAYVDASRPAAQLNADGTIAARYVYDSSDLAPAYVASNGQQQLVITNDVGTPVVTLDAATGAVVDSFDLDAWGRGSITRTDAPFGLAGGLVDPDTGLVHFGTRDYNPETARWTAPDPIGIRGGDVNQYRYVNDDPANRVDPSGLCDVVSVGASGFIGAGPAFGVGFGLVTGGPSLGVYAQWGEGQGAGGGVGVGIGCEFQNEPGNPLKQFGGEGTSTDFGIGPVSPGYDQSFNDDGGRSLIGGHVGAGPGLGGIVQTTHTSVLCLFGCGGTSSSPNPAYEPPDSPPGSQNSPGPGDQNPGNDPSNPTNACAEGPCNPDDPNAPDGGGDSSGGPGDGGAGGGSLGGPGSTGDPHLHNAAGFWFDFMAVGEFTALKSDSGDLVVQVRQVPYSDSKYVSVTSQVAILDNTERIDVAFSSTGMQLDLDGVPTDLRARIDFPNGGFIAPESRSFLVGWADGSLVRVFRNVKGLDISSRLMPERIGTIHGLLGPYSGDLQQTFLEARDGTHVQPIDPEANKFAYDDLYRTFGDSWRLSQDESLLEYEPGESTTTFDDRSFPDPNPPPVDPATTAAAQALCQQTGVPDEALDACVLDVSLTGDAGFASTTAAATRGGISTINQVAEGAVYPIAIDSTVSAGQPSSGAGVVDTTNEVDLYPFSLGAPTSVYLKAVAGCTAVDVSWALLGPTGQVLTSNEGLTGSSVCFDLRTYTLPAGTFSVRVTGGTAGEQYSFTVNSVAGTNTFPIELNEAVSPGVPAAGAGEITTPGETDIYTFSVDQPQRVYLDALGDCGTTDISWQLLDSTGAAVLTETGINTTAQCFDLGSYSLAAGSYTIKVSTTANVGAYSFEVWAIPATQTFPIGLNQVVSQGTPAAGAGEIVVPGETDLYTFSLSQAQTIYLDSLACADTDISWQVMGSDGAVVLSDSGIDATAACFDIGNYSLAAGSYTIKFTTSDGVGSYSFELWAVPQTLTFPIVLDQVVSKDVPGSGAGELAVPGETDLYTFTIDQPRQVYLQTQGECPNTYIDWRLLAADGSVVLSDAGIDATALCFDLGAYSLAAGTYTVKVTTSDGLDDYSFVVRSSPPPAT